MFKGAQIGQGFLTRSNGIARFLGARDDNGDFLYMFMQSDGRRTFHNAAGEMPLSYDCGSFIVCPYPLADEAIEMLRVGPPVGGVWSEYGNK